MPLCTGLDALEIQVLVSMILWKNIFKQEQTEFNTHQIKLKYFCFYTILNYRVQGLPFKARESDSLASARLKLSVDELAKKNSLLNG